MAIAVAGTAVAALLAGCAGGGLQQSSGSSAQAGSLAAKVDLKGQTYTVGSKDFDDSGKRKGERHIAGGRGRLRRSLHAAALPAVASTPPTRSASSRLQVVHEVMSCSRSCHAPGHVMLR